MPIFRTATKGWWEQKHILTSFQTDDVNHACIGQNALCQQKIKVANFECWTEPRWLNEHLKAPHGHKAGFSCYSKFHPLLGNVDTHFTWWMSTWIFSSIGTADISKLTDISICSARLELWLAINKNLYPAWSTQLRQVWLRWRVHFSPDQWCLVRVAEGSCSLRTGFDVAWGWHLSWNRHPQDNLQMKTKITDDLIMIRSSSVIFARCCTSDNALVVANKIGKRWLNSWSQWWQFIRLFFFCFWCHISCDWSHLTWNELQHSKALKEASMHARQTGSWNRHSWKNVVIPFILLPIWTEQTGRW